MNEEQLLKRKIIDTANQDINHYIYNYTNNLSINELSSVNIMSNELSFIPYDEWGGNPVCERKIIRFGSEELYGYDAGYPISTIRISPLSVKFAEQLNHRDYLGAIMNLGIERELVGDIIIKVPDAYVYCLSHIADYICDNLDSIKHTHIRCTICTDEIEAIKPELEEIRIEFDRNHLVKRDGYEILMENIEYAEFFEEDEKIYLRYQKDKKTFSVQIT